MEDVQHVHVVHATHATCNVGMYMDMAIFMHGICMCMYMWHVACACICGMLHVHAHVMASRVPSECELNFEPPPA